MTTREPQYIEHPDTGEMVEVDFDCMERDPECIGKLRAEDTTMADCTCNGTGWIADTNSLMPFEMPCDNCGAYAALRQRTTEHRESNHSAYRMRGFGVAIEVREHIKETLSNPRMAAWPGQVY